MLDHLSLELLHSFGERPLVRGFDDTCAANQFGQVGFLHDEPVTDHHRALDRILQLSNVAWPAILAKDIECTARKSSDLAAVLVCIFLEKVFGKGRNVTTA